MNTVGDERREDHRGADALPVRSPTALKSTWLHGEKGLGTLPLVIPGDLSRVLLGIYVDPLQAPCFAWTLLGGPDIPVFINATDPRWELRLATHGPTMQDEWTIDSLGGGAVTVLLVTIEGGA